MTADPPVRTDNRCTVCGGTRGLLPKQITQRAKAQLARDLANDPFCSSPCARKWHRTEIKLAHPEKAPAADLDWTHA